MTIFQFILIFGVAFAAILAIRFLPGDGSLAVKRILAMLFVVAAILAIVFPAALTTIANLLGIGRGTDLLLYVFIIACMLFAVSVVRAKARSDARVTDLARAVALMEARLDDRTGKQEETSEDGQS
ncbi:DUF2304 domain-containing protein [Leucobacter sp. W1038]|uniref:DUF2304 domain-containing protein n=1 Tax=Leucobacter sp. W1038 TaxID=3438281 RepID=UPI003D964108